MRSIFRFALATLFLSGQVFAQSTDGFSAAASALGGSAVNPVTENGWVSLDDYRARDCCGYTNSSMPSRTDATNADAGSTAQITNANWGLRLHHAAHELYQRGRRL